MPDYYSDPRVLWGHLPFWKKTLFPQGIFDQVPLEHRKEAFHLIAGEDLEGEPCEYEQIHDSLMEAGVADEWGQLVGDSMFGRNPKPSSS